jgi:hypothetical protein
LRSRHRPALIWINADDVRAVRVYFKVDLPLVRQVPDDGRRGMRKQMAGPLRWTYYGTILALVLSVAALMLPRELSGYNAWDRPSLIVYNLAAIATRVVIVALVAGVLGEAWESLRRRHDHAAHHRAGPGAPLHS